MTFEHKIVVGLDDIKAVSFECAQCHTRVTMPPDNIVLPQKCPNPRCDNVWISGIPLGYEATMTSPHVNFINALGSIRKQLDKGAAFKILLEFNDVRP